MNPGVKKAWIADLRTEGLKQTKKYLRRQDSFCCLGRLCEVLEIPAEKIIAAKDLGEIWAYDKQMSLLSESVLHKSGLSTENSHFLAIMNDKGLSFAEIADYLEQHPEI